MKFLSISLLSLIAVGFIAAGNPHELSQKIIIGTFDGRTPCQELAKMLGQPAVPECIKIKCRLKLFAESVNADSGSYEFQGYIFRNEQKLSGNWHMIRGTKMNPDAIVLQLELPNHDHIFLQKLNDDLFYFLDKDKNLLVGNKDFSYTLNRNK